jgi:hypothetical protein
LLLYLPAYFLMRHAVRCEQQHFAIVQHARKPCADFVWMKLDVNVSGCVPIIRLSHCYSFEALLTPLFNCLLSNSFARASPFLGSWLVNYLLTPL